MRFSILSLMLLTLAAGVSIKVWQANQPLTDFELVISGPVAKKLAPSTILRIWPYTQSKPKPIEVRVAQLPVRLPRELFLGKHVNVMFLDPHSNGELFDVQLSSALFDQPRRINIPLVSPKPILRPLWPAGGAAKYILRITQRMNYRDPPHLDSISQQLSAAPLIPQLKVYRDDSDEPFFEGDLGYGCMGAKWYSQNCSVFDDVRNTLQHNDRLRYIVEYDSGGLFPPVKTEHVFQFNEQLHAMH